MPSEMIMKILEVGLILAFIIGLVYLGLQKSQQAQELNVRYDKSLLKALDNTQKMAVWSEITQSTWDVYVYKRAGASELANDNRGLWAEAWDFAAAQLSDISGAGVDTISNGLVKLLSGNGKIYIGYMSTNGYNNFVGDYNGQLGTTNAVKSLAGTIVSTAGEQNPFGQSSQNYDVQISIPITDKRIYSTSSMEDWEKLVNFIGNYKKSGVYFVLVVGYDSNGQLAWATILTTQMNMD